MRCRVRGTNEDLAGHGVVHRGKFASAESVLIGLHGDENRLAVQQDKAVLT